jgi:hypothetical protein
MFLLCRTIVFVLSFALVLTARAQTVTTNGNGTANIIPQFSGPSSLTGSILSISPGTLSIIDFPTAQIQVRGSASTARLGQDLLGGFISSDTPGKSFRFATSNGKLTEWARLTASGEFSFTPSASLNGEVAIATEQADGVVSFSGQAAGQMHFRLSRAFCPDPYSPVDPCDFSNPFAQDFLITPYRYGMAIEYPSVIEVWSRHFSVHNHHKGCRGADCNVGANFWVGNNYDAGGLFVTAFDEGPLGGTGPRYVVVAADTFQHTSHGSLRFTVRDAASDFFTFQVGPYNAETPVAWIDGTGKGVFQGGVQTNGQDYAENVPVVGPTSQYEPGDLLEISDTSSSTFQLTTGPYSTAIAGVYSTAPGILAGGTNGVRGNVPLAMVGIAPCKVSAENGPIRPGDLLVSASTPGHAMKGIDRSRMLGAVVGKAMESLEHGSGVIPVLINLQ